jgi:GNAT superfamily N-acetyltransferase
MPRVRRFEAHEWPAYRDLRLRSLQDAPDAFGSTYALEAARSEEQWEQRLSSGTTSLTDLPLVVEEDGAYVGLAWARIDRSCPTDAHLYQVWVAPEVRGRGCGALLLGAVLAWARSVGAQRVALRVTSGDSPATRLYGRAGFQLTGDSEPLRPGSQVQTQTMVLELVGRLQ